MSALFITTFFVTDVKAQITGINYQIKYNTETCLWDFFIIINSGSATTIPTRAQFNAQYSFVVPTGTTVNSPIGRMPLQNNQNYTGTLPTDWSFGAPAFNPAAAPGFDFYNVAPKLAPASFFNNLATGDTVNIFSVDMSIMANCADQIRVFENGIDPGPDEPGMGGGNFSNGYTIGSTNQLYEGNTATEVPPSPVLSAVNLCQNGISIDLTATTSTCQGELTYAWTGPTGATFTTEDINIENATAADQGTYTVVVTDEFGCSSTLEIEGEMKPDAGADSDGCASSSFDLQGTPNAGSWTVDPTNPTGAVLTNEVSGAATVDFDATADGAYTFIYTGTVCSDSTVVTIVTPDAGPEPSAIGCFSAGTASLNAVGTGTWSIGPGSPGTANIADPTSANTTVSDFTVAGTYILVWDIGSCSDEVMVVANDNCDCVISNNALVSIDPPTFCGTLTGLTVDGGAVPESGSYLWEYSFDNATFAAASGTNTTEDYNAPDLSAGNHRFRRIYTTDTGIICSDTSNVVTTVGSDIPPMPADIAAAPQEVCIGSPVTVSVTNNPGGLYLWSVVPDIPGFVNLSSTNSVTFTPPALGVYTVSVLQSINGCTSPSASIDVTVNDVPPTPDGTTVAGTDPTACAATDGFITLTGYDATDDYTVNYQFNGSDVIANLTADGTGTLTIANLGAGTYSSFEVVSDLGCASGVFPGPISLSDPEAPDNPKDLTASPNPECLGLPITISVTDVPGATFNWSSPSPNAGLGTSTTNTIQMNATAPGLYNIFVSLTLNGCTSIDTFTSIQVNDAPPTPTGATVSGTNPTLCGGADGSIALSGYDPSTAFDVTYSDNGTVTTVSLTSSGTGVLTITGLSEGTYTDFFVTNFTGCDSGVFPGPVSLADPGSPDAPANLTAVPNPVCLGNDVTLSVDNTIGATYNWSANSADAGLSMSSTNSVTMSPTVAGTYTISVSVTIAGCTSMSSSVEILVGDTPATPLDVVGTNPTVCSGADGIITVSGYTSGETYTLDYSVGGTAQSAMLTANASGELILTGLVSGTYADFTVTNTANCPSDVFAGPVGLSDPDAPDAPTGLMVNPNPICQGETVTITATNTPGAEYTWSVTPLDAGFNPNNTNEITFTPTTDGIFMVSVVQTINSCVSPSSAPINVIVNESPATPLEADISSTNPSGCTIADGTISIASLDPSVTYSVQFDSMMVSVTRIIAANSSGVLTIDGLPSGTYTNIILTNQIGCPSLPFTGSITLSDPGAPGAPTGLTADPDPSCLGTEVTLSVDDDPNATYMWSASDPDAGLVMNTGSTTTMTATAAGSYVITVSQTVAGCSSPAAMITVTVQDVPVTLDDLTITGTDPTECGVNNGTLNLSGITLGIQQTLSYELDGVPDSRTFVLTSASDGTISLPNFGPGTYTNFVLSINATGCAGDVFPGPIVLTAPGAPAAPTAVGTNPTACGVSDGIITVGGLDPTTDYSLTYSTDGVPATADFTSNASGEIVLTGLSAGTYSNFSYLTASGCSSDVFPGPVLLEEPNAPPAPTGLTADPNPVCLGGTVDLFADFVSGATYTWIASSPDAGLVSSTTNETTMTATVRGTYTISVTIEIAGCVSSSSTVDVTVLAPPLAVTNGNLDSTDPSSCTTDDGTITLSGYDANTDYDLTYSFNGGLPVLIAVTSDADGDIALLDLPAGSYSGFELVDGNGCMSGPSTATVDLVQPDAPAAPQGLSAAPNPVCLGNVVNLSVIDNPAATYSWTVSSANGNLASSTTSVTTLNPDAAGIYTVNVTQTIAGCTSPAATLQVLVLEDCLNPDFGVTYNGVDLPGDVSTNDKSIAGTTYGSPMAIGTNPSSDMPVVNTDGTYIFSTLSVGEFYFSIEVCKPSGGACLRKPLAITVLDIESTENNPVGNHDYITAVENDDIEISIIDNDKCQSFPNCNLDDVSLISGPFDGSYSVSSGMYTPDANFSGRDSFLYQICQDPTTPESCDQEWVYIEVLPGFATQVTNGMDDYNQTALNTAITTDASTGVLANDTDPEGEDQVVTPGTFNVAGAGTLDLNQDGSYTFTPETDFIGPVDFPYTVCRGNNNNICEDATLHILVEPMAAAGAVGSCVWEDLNGNGILEPGEPGVANVPVSIYTADGLFVAETTTNEQGNYQFTDVLAGIYFLRFELIGEYEFTLPNVGNETNDSDVDDSNGEGTTSLFTLSAGQSIENIKAGLFECTNIGDNVWYDVNKNDVYDDNENGINGMRVYLWRRVNGSWVVWDETTTGKKPNSPSDDGWFNFCTAPGEYYIEVILPPTGLVQAVPFVGNDIFRDSDINNANGPGTTNSFQLQNGVDKLDLGAGYYPQAVIGNMVWHDENFNGIQNADEPRMEGVRVEVFDADSHVMLSETFTDAEGVYELDSLDRRDVYFRFTPTDGMVATIPNVVNNAIDSDVDHSYGLNTTGMISLEPATTNNHVDFGMVFGALPVKWVGVGVQENEGNHLVTWRVEQEVNVQDYHVMRRHESQDEFKQITVEGISANGVASLSEYTFNDEEVVLAGVYYYQIRQADFDGKVNYSKIVKINRDSKLDTKIFPNPTTSRTNINFTAANDGVIQITIFDMTGKLVKELNQEVNEGAGNIELELNGLVPGAYNVNIELDGQANNTRLLIIE